MPNQSSISVINTPCGMWHRMVKTEMGTIEWVWEPVPPKVCREIERLRKEEELALIKPPSPVSPNPERPTYIVEERKAAEFRVLEGEAYKKEFVQKTPFSTDCDNPDPENPGTYTQRIWTINMPAVEVYQPSYGDDEPVLDRTIFFEHSLTVGMVEYEMDGANHEPVRKLREMVVRPYRLPAARTRLRHFVSSKRNFLDLNYDPTWPWWSNEERQKNQGFEMEQYAIELNSSDLGSNMTAFFDHDGNFVLTALTNMSDELFPPGPAQIQIPSTVKGTYAIKVSPSGHVEYAVTTKPVGWDNGAEGIANQQDFYESLKGVPEGSVGNPFETMDGVELRDIETGPNQVFYTLGIAGLSLSLSSEELPEGFFDGATAPYGFMLEKGYAHSSLASLEGFSHVIPYSAGLLLMQVIYEEPWQDEWGSGGGFHRIELSMGHESKNHIEYTELSFGAELIESINKKWCKFKPYQPVIIDVSPDLVVDYYTTYPVKDRDDKEVVIDEDIDVPVAIIPKPPLYPGDDPDWEDRINEELDQVEEEAREELPTAPESIDLPDLVFSCGKWRLKEAVDIDSLTFQSANQKIGLPEQLPQSLELVDFLDIASDAQLPAVRIQNALDIRVEDEDGMYWPLELFFEIQGSCGGSAGGGAAEKGDPGASAYEIWLAAGNVGSEQDFLESLKAAPPAGKRTTDLSPADPIQGSEKLMLVQGGASKAATVAQLRDYFSE